jgi:hypothetical protein
MNWQLWITALIVIGAAFFVARRMLRRLKAFRNASFQSSCTSCVGVCSPQNDAPSKPATSLIQLSVRPRDSVKSTGGRAQ